MKYRITKMEFPWARAVMVEVPYRVSTNDGLPDKPPYRAGELRPPEWGKPQLWVVLPFQSGWVVSYTFAPEEKELLRDLLDRLELAVIGQVLSGVAQPMPLPDLRSRRQIFSLMDWLAEAVPPFQEVSKRPVFSPQEVAAIQTTTSWEGLDELEQEELSPSYRFVREFATKVYDRVPGYKSKRAVAKRLVRHWESTVMPSMYRQEPPLPPTERRVQRVLRNLGITGRCSLSAVREDPNAMAHWALSWRALEGVRMVGVRSDFHFKPSLVPLGDFLANIGWNTVTYLPEGQYLLRVTREGSSNVLTVAHGASLRVLGKVKIDQRKRHCIPAALLELGVAGPYRYDGQLAQAQEHPAFELRRRRGFADGTVLYERRLLGSVVDYVAVRGRRMSRGTSVGQALGG